MLLSIFLIWLFESLFLYNICITNQYFALESLENSNLSIVMHF